VHQRTVPYTPEKNGVAKTSNRIIVEKARSMLADEGLSKKFWMEAVNITTYLTNRSPMKIMSTTPEEAWRSKRVNLGHLRVFGCISSVHITEQKYTKWDEKSNEYILMGYCDTTKGYRLLDPNKSTDIVHARDVTCTEEKVEYHNKSMMNDSCKDKILMHLLLNEGSAVIQWQTGDSDCLEAMGRSTHW
jgi:hypothetical protein